MEAAVEEAVEAAVAVVEAAAVATRKRKGQSTVKEMAARRLCRQRRTCARSCRPQRQLPPSPQPSRRQLLTYVPSCRCRRPSRQRRDPSRPHRQNRRPRRPRTRRPRWMRWRRRWLPPRTLASRWMTSEKRSCPAMCSAHLSRTIHTTSSQDAPITAWSQQFRSLLPFARAPASAPSAYPRPPRGTHAAGSARQHSRFAAQTACRQYRFAA